MKNLIKFLIALLVIIIIAIIIIIINLDFNEEELNNEIKQNETVENGFPDVDIPQDTQVELKQNTVKEKDDFVVFSIENLIQKYFNGKVYYIQEVYTLQDYEKQSYYVYGYLLDNNKIIEYYFKLNVKDNLYSIEKIDKENYFKAKEGTITTHDNIEQYQYNDYEYVSYSSTQLARKYIDDFIFKLRFMPEKAFELIEDEYKTENFKDVTEFKTYINKNVNRFKNVVISSCEINIKENGREYVVVDNSNNYYKIIIYGAMDYKIVLDK